MTNELTVIGIIAAIIAVNYLVIYPKFAKNDVRKMAWIDSAMGLLGLGIVAIFYLGSDEKFNLFGFQVGWLIFTVAVAVILETPIFYYYLKSRGLGAQYRELWSFKKKDADWYSGTSAKSVEKQLADTKWDWLRTAKAQRNLVLTANAILLSGTVFLIFVDDSAWASYGVIHIVFVFLFWGLLRQSVRLVSEAPDAALDERTISERNSVYFTAYRILGFIALGAATAIMVYSIVADAKNTSRDDFYYLLEFTWPQVQAIFWFLFGYSMILPSMVMAWRQSKYSPVNL